MRRWVVVSLLLVVPCSSLAQRAAETMRVTVIEVPVTVVDRDGSPIPGLTAESFELYDEGKRVPIAYFEVVEPAKVAKTGAAAPPPAAATRHFLLLFDLANSSPGTVRRATEAAKEFVRTQLAPLDLAAVATFTVEAGARMVTNFTRDRDLLVDAIETLGHPSYFKIADPMMISARRATPTPVDVTDRKPEDPEKTGGPGMMGELEEYFEGKAKAIDRIQKATRDTETRGRLRIQFSQMSSIARALDRLSGQKQIILLSEGFDARVIQGRENLGFEATRQETDTVMSGEVWDVDTQERFGSASSSRDLSEMAAIFRRSDVVLHAFDIKGVRGTTDVASADTPTLQSTEALHLITRPTGGAVFKNANDMSENFAKMLRQQEIVYLLGFSAKITGKPGKFHELKVKAVGARGARVSHRAGYYEPADRISDLEKALTLGEILMTDAVIGDIPIALGATAIQGSEGKARVPMVMEIPGSALLDGIAGEKASAQLFVYAFDQNGRVVDFLQQNISLDLAKAGERVRSTGLRYYGSLRIPPGKHAVKAIVRVEESGRIGFKRSDIDVPAFETASVMPPVLFSDADDWAMLVAPSRGDEHAYPFAAGDAKYVPNGNPELAANGEYKVALFLHRVPLENLSVTPSIVSAGVSQSANVTLLGRTAADESGAMKLLFGFKTEGIAVGNHELRFDVKMKNGTQTVVSMPFTVR